VKEEELWYRESRQSMMRGKVRHYCGFAAVEQEKGESRE
jgi:hypothetical protein